MGKGGEEEERAKLKEGQIRAEAKATAKSEHEAPWAKRAKALVTASCACKDKECTGMQQAALNAYIKATKGIRVAKSTANKIAKDIVKAQTCISKTAARLSTSK